MPTNLADVERDPEPSQRGSGAQGATAAGHIVAVLPAAILVVGFGFLALTHWSSIRTAFGSGRALALIAAIAVGWVTIGWGLRRVGASVWIRAGVLSAIAIVLVLLIVVPYFRDTTVIEEFPTAVVAPPVEVAGGEDGTSDVPEPAPPAPPAAPSGPSEPAAEPEVAEPVRIAAGSLSGLGHSASGTAAIYRQPDGTYVVGLEDINIENGPDYFVYVVPGSGREGPDGGTNLGALRGNLGTQFYDGPAGVDLTGDWTVLVWCRAFAVPIAHASPG